MEHSFGAVITKKDKRDYKLELVGESVSLPEEYYTDISDIPVLHQRTTPSCGSHSFATLKMIQEKFDGKKGISYTPRLHWNKVKSKDNYVTMTGGITFNDLFNIGRTPSVCDISLLNNDTTLPLKEYTVFTPTQEQLNNAEDKTIQSYAIQYSPKFEDIKSAIFKHKAVILIYRCGQNMYKRKDGISSWQEKDILPLSPTNFPMDSAHYVVAYGYSKDRIFFRNSWGDTWGKKGDGYFDRNYMPFVHAIGTAIDKSQVTEKVVPMTWQQKFLAIIAKDNLIRFDDKLKKWVYIK